MHDRLICPWSAGENSIIITPGANRAPWELSDEAKRVRAEPHHHPLRMEYDGSC